mmetsp:Transcript_16901/g.55305  ORF Transcript_16901/g.55305 Transcript_16901/m.55305 type:complete len:539 (+) Transcript_16901:2484-4100(+)
MRCARLCVRLRALRRGFGNHVLQLKRVRRGHERALRVDYVRDGFGHVRRIPHHLHLRLVLVAGVPLEEDALRALELRVDERELNLLDGVLLDVSRKLGGGRRRRQERLAAELVDKLTKCLALEKHVANVCAEREGQVGNVEVVALARLHPESPAVAPKRSRVEARVRASHVSPSVPLAPLLCSSALFASLVRWRILLGGRNRSDVGAEHLNFEVAIAGERIGHLDRRSEHLIHAALIAGHLDRGAIHDVALQPKDERRGVRRAILARREDEPPGDRLAGGRRTYDRERDGALGLESHRAALNAEIGRAFEPRGVGHNLVGRIGELDVLGERVPENANKLDCGFRDELRQSLVKIERKEHHLLRLRVVNLLSRDVVRQVELFEHVEHHRRVLHALLVALGWLFEGVVERLEGWPVLHKQRVKDESGAQARVKVAHARRKRRHRLHKVVRHPLEQDGLRDAVHVAPDEGGVRTRSLLLDARHHLELPWGYSREHKDARDLHHHIAPRHGGDGVVVELQLAPVMDGVILGAVHRAVQELLA